MKTIFKLVACLFLFVSLQSHSVEAGFPFSENDTVTIGDKIWIQPDLFLGVTPAELEAACPSEERGICLEGASLNGYPVSGLWAAFKSDIPSIFTGYANHNANNYNTTKTIDDGAEADRFFNETGFRKTYLLNFSSFPNAGVVMGIVSGESCQWDLDWGEICSYNSASIGYKCTSANNFVNGVATNCLSMESHAGFPAHSVPESNKGVWLFKGLNDEPSKNVPAMGGIGLLALGLSMLGLGAVRLRK